MRHQVKRVSLLDLKVCLENGSITTDLHTKSTDCHQYFDCIFQHPDHIEKFHHLQSNVKKFQNL